MPRERIALLPNFTDPLVGIDRISVRVEAGFILLNERKQINVGAWRNIAPTYRSEGVNMRSQRRLNLLIKIDKKNPIAASLINVISAKYDLR